MPEIAQWLEELGLGQYAPRFPENDIDLAILPDLTDQDLKEVGVSSLGLGASCCARSPNSIKQPLLRLLAHRRLRRLPPLPRPPNAAT